MVVGKVLAVPQDLPPPGGFPPIQTARMKVPPLLSARTTFGLIFLAQVVGFIGYAFNYKKVKREEFEMRSAQFAVLPLLMAERDRAVLKQMIRNRKEEADLMKDHEGWTVGSYYGEPIYYNVPKDTFIEPTFYEYFAHADPKDVMDRVLRNEIT